MLLGVLYVSWPVDWDNRAKWSGPFWGLDWDVKSSYRPSRKFNTCNF